MAENESVTLVIRHAPRTQEAQRAVALLRSLAQINCQVTACLISDAVLMADELAKGDSQVFCLREDLEMRGPAGGSALGDVTVGDYGDLVALLTTNGTKVLGSL